jgi:hypothetical protein
VFSKARQVARDIPAGCAVSDSDSERAFEAQASARDKFDYYVTGLGAAIFTYSLNEVQALHIGWNAYTTTLAGLACILFSLYWGLKRIESVVVLKRLNFDLLHANERAGAYAKALEEYQSGQTLINYATGLTATRATAVEEYKRARAEADNAKKWLEEALKPGERYSSRRNFWLGLGVVLMMAGRVWQGYSPTQQIPNTCSQVVEHDASGQ